MKKRVKVIDYTIYTIFIFILSFLLLWGITPFHEYGHKIVGDLFGKTVVNVRCGLGLSAGYTTTFDEGVYRIKYGALISYFFLLPFIFLFFYYRRDLWRYIITFIGYVVVILYITIKLSDDFKNLNTAIFLLNLFLLLIPLLIILKSHRKVRYRDIMIIIILILIPLNIKNCLNKDDIKHPCDIEKDKDALYFRKGNYEFFAPQSNWNLSAQHINFIIEFFNNTFEQITEIPLNLKIKVYYLKNVSKCCGPAALCAQSRSNEIYLRYSNTPSETGVHEFGHIIFKSNLKLYNESFEEAFMNKIWELYYFYTGREMGEEYKKAYNCSSKKISFNECNKTKYIIKEWAENREGILKFKCTISFIDCYYSKNNDSMIYLNWIKFIQLVNNSNGIKNNTDLYDKLEMVYPKLNDNLLAWEYKD